MQKLLEEFAEPSAELGTSRKIAEELVARETLTRWQAEQLLRGKHRGFFLGPYRILGMLGEGGMGKVYLAEHQMMRRRCAIKVLPTKSQKDKTSIDLFYREAQAVAALDHPNIVRAYDVNKDLINDTEFHYLVMEYVDGLDLQRMVQKQGVLSYEQAADTIRQSAEGLGHAHERGFVHRDIKPANLLVDTKGVVKVLDLGLARFFDDKDASDSDSSVTTRKRSESILGTADYLAPEQAINSDDVDARADIYSLGQTFYFILMGHAPFPKGTVAERLLAHQTKFPAPILKGRPDAPPDLVAIIDKMTSKRPEHRYQAASEVVETLDEWLSQFRGDEDNSLGRSSLLAGAVRQSYLKRPDARRSASAGSEEGELELAPLDDEPSPPTRQTAKSGKNGGKKASDNAKSSGKESGSSMPSDDSSRKVPKPGGGDSLLDELPELPSSEDGLAADLPGGASPLGDAAAPGAPGSPLGSKTPKRRKKQSPMAAVLASPILWVSLGGLAVLVLILAIVFSGGPADKPPSSHGKGKKPSVKSPETPLETPPEDGHDPVVPLTGEPEPIVDVGVMWKWLHPADGIDPGTDDRDFHETFYLRDYDDSTWKKGPDSPGPTGGFGYNPGDDPQVPWEQPESEEDRKTAYLRHEFTTDSRWENLYITLQRDDGVIVYLDGKEVVRDNVLDGPEAYDLWADEVVSSKAEVEVEQSNLGVSLEPGKHVLAISLHNREGGSSDLRIAEISLHGTRVAK